MESEIMSASGGRWRREWMKSSTVLAMSFKLSEVMREEWKGKCFPEWWRLYKAVKAYLEYSS